MTDPIVFTTPPPSSTLQAPFSLSDPPGSFMSVMPLVTDQPLAYKISLEWSSTAVRQACVPF